MIERELLKAYRDNRLINGSPRRYINKNGNEVLASVACFVSLLRKHYISAVDDYRFEITDEGKRFLASNETL